jgi:hypothetical protein
MTSTSTTRHLSRPMASMLEAAGLTVDIVDDAIGEQIAKGRPSALRVGHPLVDRLRAETGLGVVLVGRRYRRLMLEIEQPVERAMRWIYREHSPVRSEFLCRGKIPETFAAGLGGEPLSRIADPPWQIGTAIIETVTVLHDGWLSVAITPCWLDFKSGE